MEMFLLFIALVVALPSATSYALKIWFDQAKFFVEYCNLFGLHRFIKPLSQYNASVTKGNTQGFLEFLECAYSANFIVRLITCMDCLSFWVSLAFVMPLIFLIETSGVSLYMLFVLVFYTAARSIIIVKGKK